MPPERARALPFEVEDGGPVLHVAGSALVREQAFSLYQRVGDWLSRQEPIEVLETPAAQEPPRG